MLAELVRRWDAELADFLGFHSGADSHGFHRMAAEHLRADPAFLEALADHAGLPREAPRLRQRLLDDIEDGNLPLTVNTSGSPHDADLFPIWSIDVHEMHFPVPEHCTLTEHDAARLNRDTPYRLDPTGAVATYAGSERHAVAAVTPHALMEWSAGLLQSDRALLTETLNCAAGTQQHRMAVRVLEDCSATHARPPAGMPVPTDAHWAAC